MKKLKVNENVLRALAKDIQEGLDRIKFRKDKEAIDKIVIFNSIQYRMCFVPRFRPMCAGLSIDELLAKYEELLATPTHLILTDEEYTNLLSFVKKQALKRGTTREEDELIERYKKLLAHLERTTLDTDESATRSQSEIENEGRITIYDEDDFDLIWPE